MNLKKIKSLCAYFDGWIILCSSCVNYIEVEDEGAFDSTPNKPRYKIYMFDKNQHYMGIINCHTYEIEEREEDDDR